MTNEMRARVEKAVEISDGNLTIEFAKSAITQREREISYWNSLPAWQQGVASESMLSQAKGDIAYYQAVIEYLMEKAAAQAVAESVEVLVSIINVANRAKAIRRAVATLANKLHKASYNLSDAFKRAWVFIKAFAGLMPAHRQ